MGPIVPKKPSSSVQNHKFWSPRYQKSFRPPFKTTNSCPQGTKNAFVLQNGSQASKIDFSTRLRKVWILIARMGVSGHFSAPGAPGPFNPVPKVPKKPSSSGQNHQILSLRYQKCFCPPFKTTKSLPQNTKNAFVLRSKPPIPVPNVPKMPLSSVQNHKFLSPRYQKSLRPPFKTTKSCPQGTKNAFVLRSKPPNLVPKVPKMPLSSVQNHQFLSPRYQKCLCPPFKTIKSLPKIQKIPLS